jgi:hypothetical protein
MKSSIIKVRIVQASATAYRGIVMHGDSIVESTGNISDRDTCERIAETLACIYRVSLRAS